MGFLQEFRFGMLQKLNLDLLKGHRNETSPKFLFQEPSEFLEKKIFVKIFKKVLTSLRFYPVINVSISLGHHGRFTVKTSFKIQSITSPEMPQRIFRDFL